MVSLTLINSSKGQILLNNIQNKLDSVYINKEESRQPQLEYPTKISPMRELFWKEYMQYGFKFIAHKYLDYSIKNRIKEKIKVFLK